MTNPVNSNPVSSNGQYTWKLVSEMRFMKRNVGLETAVDNMSLYYKNGANDATNAVHGFLSKETRTNPASGCNVPMTAEETGPGRWWIPAEVGRRYSRKVDLPCRAVPCRAVPTLLMGHTRSRLGKATGNGYGGRSRARVAGREASSRDFRQVPEIEWLGIVQE
jgi:hypothetical protein